MTRHLAQGHRPEAQALLAGSLFAAAALHGGQPGRLPRLRRHHRPHLSRSGDEVEVGDAADDGQHEELPRGGRHDDCGLTCDPPEIVRRQVLPDDDHREKDRGRYAGIHDRLQQGVPQRQGSWQTAVSRRPSA
jgi:hypothetical protein